MNQRDPFIGQTYSHYRILEKIGEGGMGVVYKALDVRLDRTVAIKILPSGLSIEIHNRQRFFHEAKSVSALNHPNICTLYDIGYDRGIDFIVMEYVDGETLRGFLNRKGALTEEETIRIGIQICKALAATHKKGIIHRDIKPENIMMTLDGLVKILDFGLAKLNDTGRTISSTMSQSHSDAIGDPSIASSSFYGTVSYMSPEQIENKPLDDRTDIYSLGMVLYEMLAGELPFKDESPHDIMNSIIQTDFSRLIKIPNHGSKKMTDLIKKAVAREPENRYRHIEKLLKSLIVLRDGPLKGHRFGRSKSNTKHARATKTMKVFFFILPVLMIGSILRILFDLQIFPIQKEKKLITLGIVEFKDKAVQKPYLTDGIWKDVSFKLSKFKDLFVVPIIIKQNQDNIVYLGRDYNTDYILEGSVEYQDRHLVFHGTLTDVSQEKTVWVGTLENKASEIFDIEQKLIYSIIKKLKLKAAKNEIKMISQNAAVSIKAYDYYLRGKEYYAMLDKNNIHLAINLYYKALQIDGRLALAHAGIGEAFLTMNNQYITRSESYIDSAKAHTQKALELDDQLPEAHLISGDIYRTLNPDDVHRAISEYILSARLNPTLSSPIQHLIRFYNELGNFREAEIWGEKFIQIQPCNALGYIEMGLIKWFQGRLEDAIHYYDKAIEIEPAMSWCYGQKGYCMLLNGKWDEAKTLYMKNLELDQKSTQALASLGRIAFIQSQPEQAIAIYHTLLEAGADGFDHFILIQILRSRGETPFVQKLIDLGFAVCRKNLVKSPHDHRWLADLAILNALAGDRVAAERNISEAKKTRDFKGNFIRKNRVLFREAVVYSVLKNHQKAISILEQVVAMRMYSRNYLKESIEFMDLRDDPDFIRLVNSQSASF